MTTTCRPPRGCRCRDAVAEVASWRRDYLRALGLPPDVVEAVVRDPRFDLHALLELLEHGCPPALAVRILAPVEREGGG